MRTKTEDLIQQQVVMWFTNTYCLKHHNPRCIIFAVPNGGSRNVIEAKKFKNTGLLKGASDLIIVLPGKVLFVELKTDTGRQAPEQIEFENRVKDLGFEYLLCRSLDDFQQSIEYTIDSIFSIK